MQNDIAGMDEGEDRGRDRRHAGREQRAFLGALVDREPVLDDFAVGMIEPRINQARTHSLGRLAPTPNEIEEVLWVFDGNGFTMACLAVRIRNGCPAWGDFRNDDAVRSGDATASNGSSQRCEDEGSN